MLELLDSLYIMAMCRINCLKEEERGAVDLVTIVVLIGIAIVLAVLFRSRIEALLGTLFDNIESNATKATS